MSAPLRSTLVTRSDINQKLLRQDGLSKNLPIPPMLNIWSLPDVPVLVISDVLILTDTKKIW